MNATEIVPVPMRRNYDVQRVYSNVYGNNQYSYMYDPNVYYVGFPGERFRSRGFGQATLATALSSNYALLAIGAVGAIAVGVYMAKRSMKKSGFGRRRHRR